MRVIFLYADIITGPESSNPTDGHESMTALFSVLSYLVGLHEMGPPLIQRLSNVYKQDP
jgi:hypothetical protein